MPNLEPAADKWAQDYGFVRTLEERVWRVIEALGRYVAEFLGSFLLTFTAVCNHAGHAHGRESPIWVPTSNGCMLLVAVYALGPVSGGHFNPAISLASGLAHKGHWWMLVRYVVVQVCGSICGGVAASWEYNTTLDPALGPRKGFSMSDCMTVELFFTAMMSFVFLNVASARGNNPVREGNHFYGLAIAFVAVAGGHAASGISGAYFNPAVTFGLAASDAADGWGIAVRYTIFQALGAMFAALMFLIVRPAEDFEERDFRAHKHTLQERCLCEGLGSLAITFTCGLMQFDALQPARPWAVAATVICMTYAVGDISGAHFNPAVTLAVHLARPHGKSGGGLRDGLAYIAAQTGFAMIGALMYTAVANGHNVGLIENRVVGHGGKYTMWQIAVVELILTSSLAFTVLSVTTMKGIVSPLKRNYYNGLAVGLCIAAGGFSAGPVSGAIMNPAISIATSFAHLVDHGKFWPCLIYSMVQLSGGVVAAVVFLVTRPYGIELERAAISTKCGAIKGGEV